MTSEIFARITGFLFSDGCLYHSEKHHYYEVGFSLGSKEDAEAVSEDLKSFNLRTKIEKTYREFYINNRKINMTNYRIKYTSKRLFYYFKNLGVPVGKKTNKSYVVPDWVMNGSIENQKAFLSGFLGGDGPKITIKVTERKVREPYNHININDIEFYKRLDLIENGFVFARQIAFLLEKQGVSVTRIFNKGEFPRRDKSYSTSIHISLGKGVESALAYSKIGFAYCAQKSNNLKNITTFLNELDKRRSDWRKKYFDALNLYNSGVPMNIISGKLNISYAAVFGWIKLKRKPTIERHYIKFDQWGDANGSIESGKF